MAMQGPRYYEIFLLNVVIATFSEHFEFKSKQVDISTGVINGVKLPVENQTLP